ncbi:hypothetical protein A2G06_16815 (plasmid) [Geobacter anodireducens]|nr:hypothetical protein A2G06_16815 [Geobacter anodireducens]
MKEIDGLIADLGSVPERRDFEQVMSPYIKKIFLIRWMTPERWLPVSQRLHDYDSNTLVLFVMPKDFFTEATGIRNIESLAPVEYQFLDGYLFQDNSDNNDEADDRIAFVCGLGGVHSETGYRQLIEAIKALSSVKELMPNVKTDAWIGNNIELYKFAKACTGIDQVYGISDCARPNWNKYKVVLGRSSYNTLLEIMTTSAIFVTAKFESDGEWGYHFYKYLEKYGVITAPYPDEQHMRSAVLHALLTHKMDDACIRNRQLEFRNAASEMISISKQFIRA